MKLREYNIKHVGWLLACDAPENVEKGKRMLPELTDEDQVSALAYRDECKAVYATAMQPSA